MEVPGSRYEIKGKDVLPEVIGHTVRDFALRAIPAALLFSLSLAFYEVLGWKLPAILVTGVFAAGAIFFDAPLVLRGLAHLAFLLQLPKRTVEVEGVTRPALSVLSPSGLTSMSLLILVPLLNVALDVMLVARLIVVESR